MNLPGNLIWLIFGGFFAALGYFFCGIMLCITVVGIPWGLQCFKLAGLVLWPFGKEVVSSSSGAGCFSVLFNIIWLLSGGLYTALVHLFFGLVLTITVIGIPFARQHFKLLEISMMPFGKNNTLILLIRLFVLTFPHPIHIPTPPQFHNTSFTISLRYSGSLDT